IDPKGFCKLADRKREPFADVSFFILPPMMIVEKNGNFIAEMSDNSFWIDGEIRLPGGGQYVFVMKIAMQIIDVGSLVRESIVDPERFSGIFRGEFRVRITPEPVKPFVQEDN